jgi:hypothetical protein
MNTILTYNQFLIDSYIHYPQFERYKSKHFEEWYPIYRNFPLEGWSDYPYKDTRRSVFASSVWFFDRTNTIPHYLNINNDSPIPKLKPFTEFFSNICLKRAKELIDTGQKINLFWSGGLDSTNAFFCLHKFAPKNQLKVYLTYDSIIESGNLFDRYIKTNYEYDLSLPKPPQFQNWDNGIILNGSAADQLFGIPYGINNDNFHLPYQNFINDQEQKFIQPVLDKFPVPIKTYFDFKWFQPFVFKYVAGKKIIYQGRQFKKEQKISAFYDTDDFQIWSMLNYEPKFIDGDINTLKWPLRNLIYENSGEKNYAYNKKKNNSNYSVYNPHWLLTDGEGKCNDWKQFLGLNYDNNI